MNLKWMNKLLKDESGVTAMEYMIVTGIIGGSGFLIFGGFQSIIKIFVKKFIDGNTGEQSICICP